MRSLSRAAVPLMPLALAAGTPATTPLAEVIACAELTSASWGGFTIDSAAELDPSVNAPGHCRVRGTIDAEIHFELLLPKPGDWNGRFVMGGGGGFVGTVTNQALSYAPYMLGEGFATVGTDTGHQGSQIDASWALDREDREINFGHRAVHLTAEAAKTIMRVHYGRDIAYSYWLGCSRGGGQGMVESQRFPDDFDGIVVGAPAYDWPGIGAHFIQTQQAMYPHGPANPPTVGPETLQLLHDAVLEACDGLDGLEDGLLTDPRDCDFEPADLPRCGAGGAAGACVTDAQVTAIETVYRGAIVDGEQVHNGFPLGGEGDPGNWSMWVTGVPNGLGSGTPSLHFAFGTQMYKYLVFDDPAWDYSAYDFTGWAEETSRAAEILNATDPDLTAFEVAGGKIIFWNGWSDAAITALGTIEYYEDVQRQHSDASEFARLFLLPGVDHCAGGPGPDTVDWLAAIRAWVEEDVAPQRLVANKVGTDGTVEMSRPICAYPARASYVGNGDVRNEESFECVLREGR